MKQRLLEEATRAISGRRLDDLGASLGALNLPFGLAKIRTVQKELGIEPDARFHMTPDFSVTRNRTRWNAGFAYGGILEWSGDLVPLDLKPNACGMLVGRIDDEVLSRVRERLERGVAESIQMGDIAAVTDIDFSNHFLQLYRCEQSETRHLEAGDLVFVLHGSGKEFRHRLYYDRPTFVFEDSVRRFETPWGPLHCLVGEAAIAYQEGFDEVEVFSRHRREAFARLFFEEFEIVANRTHQGLVQPGRMLLGAMDATTDEVVPFTMSEELPVYLLRGTRAVTPLPHGGGYKLKRSAQEVSVEGGHDSDREFKFHEGDVVSLLNDIREEPYGYRGLEALDLALQQTDVEVAAVLNPLWRITEGKMRPISPART